MSHLPIYLYYLEKIDKQISAAIHSMGIYSYSMAHARTHASMIICTYRGLQVGWQTKFESNSTHAHDYPSIFERWVTLTFACTEPRSKFHFSRMRKTMFVNQPANLCTRLVVLKFLLLATAIQLAASAHNLEEEYRFSAILELIATNCIGTLT